MSEHRCKVRRIAGGFEHDIRQRRYGQARNVIEFEETPRYVSPFWVVVCPTCGPVPVEEHWNWKAARDVGLAHWDEAQTPQERLVRQASWMVRSWRQFAGTDTS